MLARPLASILILLSALLAAGCNDPLSPGDVAGTYVLRSVAGEALPTVLHADEGVTVNVLADTLRLNADGTGSNAWVRNYLFASGEASGPHHIETQLTFDVSDGRVRISWACDMTLDQVPLALSCVEGPHVIAERTAAGLRVTTALGTERLPLVYEAVAEGVHLF